MKDSTPFSSSVQYSAPHARGLWKLTSALAYVKVRPPAYELGIDINDEYKGRNDLCKMQI
jgi:hypothetical protein